MKNEDQRISLSGFLESSLPPGLKQAVTLATEKQARDISVLIIGELSNLTDYLIICSGTSTTHNKAICDWMDGQLKAQLRVKKFGVEGSETREWILLDYVDFVVHIMLEQKRRKYQLEKLWMDAKRYDIQPDQ